MSQYQMSLHQMLRNTISFVWSDLLSNLQSDLFLEKNYIYSITNSHIHKIIQFLKKYDFDKKTYITIQGNEYNYGLIIKNSNITDLTEVCQLFYISFLEINDIVIYNNKYLDIIKGTIIFRNIKSFHQTDDTIKDVLYDVILQECNNYEELVCLGGEMYIFSKILNYKKIMCYSDFESIVEDTKFNLMTDKNIQLVSYDTFIFSLRNYHTCAIINTGKTGMTKNICENINKNKISKVVVISCNEKSFVKDMSMLKNYILLEKISVNYVSINVLKNIFN